jgi:hypothetical protein
MKRGCSRYRRSAGSVGRKPGCFGCHAAVTFAVKGPNATWPRPPFRRPCRDRPAMRGIGSAPCAMRPQHGEPARRSASRVARARALDDQATPPRRPTSTAGHQNRFPPVTQLCLAWRLHAAGWQVRKSQESCGSHILHPTRSGRADSGPKSAPFRSRWLSPVRIVLHISGAPSKRGSGHSAHGASPALVLQLLRRRDSSTNSCGPYDRVVVLSSGREPDPNQSDKHWQPSVGEF